LRLSCSAGVRISSLALVLRCLNTC
jgi:hypothetical protein